MERTASTGIVELKLKIAEHIWVQNHNRKTSVADILAENKVSVQPRPDLTKILKTIFLAK